MFVNHGKHEINRKTVISLGHFIKSTRIICRMTINKEMKQEF